jgi:hypothetical protein
VRVERLALVFANVRKRTTAKYSQGRVIRFALLNDLVQHGFWWKSSRRQHVKHLLCFCKCFAPERPEELGFVQHCSENLSEYVVIALSNTILLRRSACGVLAPDAMLAAECIPLVSNVLTAFVFVEEANDGFELLVLVLWSPWTLGCASEITCSVTLYISLEA